MGFSVVVVDSDPQLAQSLICGLPSDFHFTHLKSSGSELRELVATDQPGAVILDMESSRLSDVRNLHRDFPSLPIVCTHRIPDEELWVAALEAGAADVCPAADARHVLASVLRNVAMARSASA